MWELNLSSEEGTTKKPLKFGFLFEEANRYLVQMFLLWYYIVRYDFFVQTIYHFDIASLHFRIVDQNSFWFFEKASQFKPELLPQAEIFEQYPVIFSNLDN